MVFFAVAGGVVGVVVIGAASSSRDDEEYDDYNDYSDYDDYEVRQRREREARREHKRQEMESYRSNVKVIVDGQMQSFLSGTKFAGKSYDQLEDTNPSQIDSAVKKKIADQGKQKAQGAAMLIKGEINNINQAIDDLEKARTRLSSEVQK